MWLTSKRPAAVRVAMCSATIPEYSTGMSQPPKFTILALRRRCTPFNAVLRSWAVVGDVTRNSQSRSVKIETNMQLRNGQERQTGATKSGSGERRTLARQGGTQPG